MSVQEPPALVRSLEEGQHSSRERGRILAQLSVALENPDIKALEVKDDATVDVEALFQGARSMALAPA